MYKFTAEQRIKSDILDKYPEYKDRIITDMLINISVEMNKRNCYAIAENSVRDHEVEFRIEGYVMTEKEFKEIIGILKLIKGYLPSEYEDFPKRIYDLLTKEPV